MINEEKFAAALDAVEKKAQEAEIKFPNGVVSGIKCSCGHFLGYAVRQYPSYMDANITHVVMVCPFCQSEVSYSE